MMSTPKFPEASGIVTGFDQDGNAVVDHACEGPIPSLESGQCLYSAAQMTAYARAAVLAEQAQVWSSAPPPEREMIYAWHPDLVEDDFNPTGVVTAWFSDEWRAGIWNGYTDELNIQPIQIAMWRRIDGPMAKP
jgi:hypothetical protein